MITLAGNIGVQGVLWATDDTGLVVREAPGEPVMVFENGPPVPVDGGEVFVPADKVLFVQVFRSVTG